MLEKLPFYLYKRKLKSGKEIYYVKFPLPDGTVTAGRSTGETSKKKATLKAWAYLRSGNPTRLSTLTLKDYASTDFFSWDREWAISKRSAGKKLSPDQCIKNNQLLNNHVIRLLGDTPLATIDSRTVISFRNALYQESLAGSTINKCLGVLNSVLSRAREDHLIRYMPDTERAALDQDEAGILSDAELISLFAADWPDVRAFMASLLAAATGFRLGEIIGLRIKNIEPGTVTVSGSWNDKRGVFKNRTKNNQPYRRVPVPEGVEGGIQKLIELNPWGKDSENYLFFSLGSKARPMDASVAREGFYSALGNIGIPAATRKERNINFHSHRHYFNSLLVENRIPLQKIQRITGHLSASMTQRYYHSGDLADVKQVQELIFGKILPFPREASGE